jgi:hypothetical protein
MMEAIGALMAQKQAAQATRKLQNGVSPGVRASGPFAKQIAQAQMERTASPFKKDPRAASPFIKDPRLLTTAAIR